MIKKILLLCVIAAVCLQQVVGAQTNPIPAQESTANKSPEQRVKLAEAVELSFSVVKLYNEGQFDQALPMAERALKLRENILGAEHPLVADALVNLGAVNLAKGKTPNGKSLYRRALAIYEKTPEARIASIIKLHDDLGVLERFAFADYSAAIEHFEQNLALREKSLGAGHADVVKNLYVLVELYELQLQNEKALASHRRVIGIMEKNEATEPYKLAGALERFVCLGERLKLTAETKKAQQRADEIRAREKERQEREAAQRKASGAGGELLDGGVLNGRALSKPQPSYPSAARDRRVTGTVKVFITVDEQGRVIEAFPCGHPLLTDAAVRAAYSARFSPTLLRDQPVKVNGVIIYNFMLQR